MFQGSGLGFGVELCWHGVHLAGVRGYYTSLLPYHTLFHRSLPTRYSPLCTLPHLLNLYNQAIANGKDPALLPIGLKSHVRYELLRQELVTWKARGWGIEFDVTLFISHFVYWR